MAIGITLGSMGVVGGAILAIGLINPALLPIVLAVSLGAILLISGALTFTFLANIKAILLIVALYFIAKAFGGGKRR